MEIASTEALSRQEFEGLALDEPFLSLLGFVERAFSILIWGRAGSGKSTLAMGLARALLPFAKMTAGTVLYVSSEEGPHMTSTTRAVRLGALDRDLLISDFSGIQALREAILKYDVRFLIVDSVTVVDPTTSEAKDFLQWCRKEGIGIALVAHALKGGEGYKGNSRLGHDIYVEVHCYQDEDGIHRAETIKNRYLPLAQIAIPMTAAEIQRTNPDCTTSPQSAQCKAIFASLDERDERRRARKKTSKRSPSKKKRSSSKKKAAKKHSKTKHSKKKSSSKKASSKAPSKQASSMISELEAIWDADLGSTSDDDLQTYFSVLEGGMMLAYYPSERTEEWTKKQVNRVKQLASEELLQEVKNEIRARLPQPGTDAYNEIVGKLQADAILSDFDAGMSRLESQLEALFN